MGQGRRRPTPGPLLVALVASWLALAAMTAGAQCLGIYWENTTGGFWEDPGNWEGNQVPGPTDTACITASGVYTVTVNTDVEVASLVVGVGSGGLATLLVTDSPLTAASFSVVGLATVDLGGMLTLQGAPFSSTGSGQLVNHGAIELGGGELTTPTLLSLPLSNYGSVFWGGYAEISGPVTTGIDSLLAPTVGAGSAQLTIGQGFTNNGVIRLGDSTTHLSVRGTLINEGSIEQLAAKNEAGTRQGHAVLDTELHNRGTVAVSEVGIEIATASANHRNESGGLITISIGELRFDLSGAKAPSSFTNIGIIDIAGSKRAKLVGATLAVIGGQFSPADGQLTGSGNLLLHGTTIAGGNLVNSSLRLEMADSLVSTATVVANEATLVVHGSNSVDGQLSNGPGGSMTVAGSAAFGDAGISFAGDFVNYGALELSDFSLAGAASAITVTTGALINQADGEITVRGDFPGLPVRRVVNAQLDNRGDLITVDGDLKLTGGSAPHSNSGRIILVGGNLSLELTPAKGVLASSSFTNTGIIDIGASTSWSTGSSAKGVRASSSFTNTGIIDIGAAGVMIQAAVDFSNADGGELVGDGELDVSTASSAVNGGAISPGASPGRLTIRGDMAYGPTAALNVEIAGRVVGAGFDRLDHLGAVAVDGSLNVVLDPFFVPVAGDSFAVLSYVSRSGGFATASLPPLPAGLAWSSRWEATELWLQVICVEGPDLAVTIMPDKNPVTVEHFLSYRTQVANLGPLPATGVVVRDQLDPDLLFVPTLSSPVCADFAGLVECELGSLAGFTGGTVTITVSPLVARLVANEVEVSAAECDPAPADNHAGVGVWVVAAEPCDADASAVVDAEDPLAAVLHIFGERAPGNPDCTEEGGVNAGDLSKILWVVWGL